MKKESEFELAATDAIISSAKEFPAVNLGMGPSRYVKGGRYFEFEKINETGFNVGLEVFEYGVYPYADGWHGAPWDVTIWQLEELSKSIREFIRSTLTPVGCLEVHYSNDKPYKYILNHSFEGGLVADETGLFFFNWFGTRSQKFFINDAQNSA